VGSHGPGRATGPAGPASAAVVEALAPRLREAPALLLLLDYDGTLVPFAPTPELAQPDDELLRLLLRLAVRPSTEIHVVSGRPGEILERWLGVLPIGLHAEHGFSYRAPGAATWVTGSLPTQEWRSATLALMRAAAAQTPGAFVEEKCAGVAWHYRLAEAALGDSQARALVHDLRRVADHAPIEILHGAKVVEVLTRGVHKGCLVPAVVARAPVGALVVAIGDDRTDEDLFAALPRGALAIHVGAEPTGAPIRLGGVTDVRALLHAVADDGQR
jgi:trehalose 6-phosphate synthase/phosphatase